MKAAVFIEPGRPLELRDLPDPTPGQGEVVLKVGRCGICGSDLHLTSPGELRWRFPSNTVLGHEYSGEVVALGPGVTNLRVGDRIAAQPFTGCGKCLTCLAGHPMMCEQQRYIYGGYAEYSRAAAWPCTKLPATLSMEDGALVEPLAVGLHAVIRSQVQVGMRLLVLGAGPIGLGIVYWAHRFGARSIAVLAKSERRKELALEMGASSFVAASENALDEVKASLGGSPEIVFECIGINGALQTAIEHVQRQGTVASLGCCSTPDGVIPFVASAKEVTLRFPLAYTEREFEMTARALDAGGIDPRHMITDRITLDELPEMFESMRTRTTQCKVMVDPWG